MTPACSTARTLDLSQKTPKHAPDGDPKSELPLGEQLRVLLTGRLLGLLWTGRFRELEGLS